MRRTLCLCMQLVISLSLVCHASANYKIKETQIRELPGSEMIEIGVDRHYIKGRIVTAHIQAKKGLLEKNSSVSIACTLSKDGKEFGAVTFHDNIEKDSGALYLVNVPFSPWISYYGEDITVRFEIIEITREDVLRTIVSTLSGQTSTAISFAPKAAMVFDAVKPIIDQIIRLREVDNRIILKAERVFSVPEQIIRGVLPLRYQHYIVFDNTPEGKKDTPTYEYIKKNCELDKDGYLWDKKTNDIYRGATYVVFTFETKTQLVREIAQLKDFDFYKYFEMGEVFAKHGNWNAVTQMGYELSRSIFENGSLHKKDRDFVMTKYETMASIYGYPEKEHSWAERATVTGEEPFTRSLHRLVWNLERAIGWKESTFVFVEDFIYKDKSVGGSFGRYFTDQLRNALSGSSKLRLLESLPHDLMGGQKEQSSAYIKGHYWDLGQYVAVLAYLKSLTNEILASTSVLIPKDNLEMAAHELLPPGYDRSTDERINVLTEKCKGVSGLKINLWTDRGEGGIYKEGESAVIYLRSNQDCFVKLFYFDASGNIVQIFPNQHHPSSRIQAQSVYRIPSESSFFQFEIQPPFGVEIIKAFASTTSLEEISTSFFEDRPYDIALADMRRIRIVPEKGYAETSVTITTIGK